MKIQIETDHKPLVPLLGSRYLDDLPQRILRFRLRLARVDYSIVHVPGRLLFTTGALSRSPRPTIDNDGGLEEEVECLIEISVDSLPATQQKLAEYVDAQSVDPVCSRVATYCQQGWPDHKGRVEPELRVFWRDRGSFSLCKGLLLYGDRIVVPDSLRKMTLKKIHEGHQGIQRCRFRARCSVWWPGMMAQIKDLVERCPVCVRNFRPRHEPLISTPLPDYPWESVASDLFHLNGHNYLIVVDYLSRFPEVIKLSSTTSASVITAFKNSICQIWYSKETCNRQWSAVFI